jgi:hypothetical protein
VYSENRTLNADVRKTLHIFDALPIWIKSVKDNARRYGANESFGKISALKVAVYFVLHRNYNP